MMTMIQNMLASVAVIVIATFLENVSASNSNSECSVINMNSKWFMFTYCIIKKNISSD
jgi:hypothetical protein